MTLRPLPMPEPVDDSWTPVNLVPIIAGEEVEPPPDLLRRTDGVALLYPGKVQAFIGEPESCKGWIVLTACAQAIARDEHVVYIDFEDEAAAAVGRLRALGVAPSDIAGRFTYVRPNDPQPRDPDFLGRLLNPMPVLAVLDGVTEAATLEGLSINDNEDMARWQRQLAKQIARAGVAVGLIDHVGRDRENRGRNAIGAQHKLSGVHAQYVLEVVPGHEFGRGRTGKVKVTIGKDRGGHVRRHQEHGSRIADMLLTSSEDGSVVTVELGPPEASTDIDGNFRPTFLMERVSAALEASVDGLAAGRGGLLAIQGKDEALREAAARLVDEGYARLEQAGQRKTYHYIRAFTKDTNS